MVEITAVLGNIGEFVGAIGVVVTLVYLSIQIRHSRELIEANKAATEENTRLVRAATMDRYNETVGRWRGRLIEDPGLASMWRAAMTGDAIQGIDAFRLENLWVDWINTYRTNYRRADAVGDEGLKHQAVRSVVSWMRDRPLFLEMWEWSRPFNEAGSPDFVRAIDGALAIADMGVADSPLFRRAGD